MGRVHRGYLRRQGAHGEDGGLQYPGECVTSYAYDCLQLSLIQVAGEKLVAHKCILSAHSPVFREMFVSPASLEADTGVVTEKSIPNPAAFQEFIRYCYKGDSMAPWNGEYEGVFGGDLGVAVYQLADKYCVDSLKAKTEKFLVDGLTSINLMERIVLADSHSADILKQVGGFWRCSCFSIMIPAAISGLHQLHSQGRFRDQEHRVGEAAGGEAEPGVRAARRGDGHSPEEAGWDEHQLAQGAGQGEEEAVHSGRRAPPQFPWHSQQRGDSAAAASRLSHGADWARRALH